MREDATEASGLRAVKSLGNLTKCAERAALRLVGPGRRVGVWTNRETSHLVDILVARRSTAWSSCSKHRCGGWRWR